MMRLSGGGRMMGGGGGGTSIGLTCAKIARPG